MILICLRILFQGDARRNKIKSQTDGGNGESITGTVLVFLKN
jgi:hypothetical protein